MRQLKITKQVTNRETASLDKYLQEIGKVDLITADEEVELAQRIKAGDQIALEKLTKANLRFVVSVAKQYQNDVKESMKNSGRHVSMDAPLVEGEDSNLYDVLNSGESPNPDRELLHESLRTEIERALETLTPREADVIRLYFGLGNQHPMTLEEIGETFDLTRERVRQIKEKAIRRLKHTSRSKILKTYLG